MDRAAKLAAAARWHVARELAEKSPKSREVTRSCLAVLAETLGLSERREISAAVDQALTDAGTTP